MAPGVAFDGSPWVAAGQIGGLGKLRFPSSCHIELHGRCVPVPQWGRDYLQLCRAACAVFGGMGAVVFGGYALARASQV